MIEIKLRFFNINSIAIGKFGEEQLPFKAMANNLSVKKRNK